MIRIQRKREKGWRMPPNTVYVGRPTKWGNPFRDFGDMVYLTVPWRRRRKYLDSWVYFHMSYEFGDAKTLYQKCLMNTAMPFVICSDETDALELKKLFERIHLDIHELNEKDLACWCSPYEPCHANVLIELCNKEDKG